MPVPTKSPEELQRIIHEETARARELRKGTLYVVDSDANDASEVMAMKHERKAEEASKDLDWLETSSR